VWPPILLHILFGSLLVLPLYGIAKRLFNENAAIVVGILAALSPLLIHNSLLPMAETPHALFVVTGMYCVVSALQTQSQRNKSYWFIAGGLCITIATGLRYEAWLTLILISGIILYNKQWKGLVLFGVFAMIFPTGWMIGNYLDHGNPFYGADYATWYNLDFHGVNENINDFERLRRTWFYPISMLHFLPYGIAFIAAFGMLIALIRKRISLNVFMWFIPFCIFLPIMISKAVGGTLLTQHRFAITLLVLVLPFVGVLVSKRWNRHLVLGTTLVVAGFYLFQSRKIHHTPSWEKLLPESQFKTMFTDNRFYTFNQLEPIPKLVDTSGYETLNTLKPYLKNNTPLILDFVGWENSYFIGYHSGVRPELITFLPAKELNTDVGFLEMLWLRAYPNISSKGIVMLAKGSKYYELAQEENSNSMSIPIEDQRISLTLIDSIGSNLIFTFDTEFFKNK
jgi:hypothetical protein